MEENVAKHCAVVFLLGLSVLLTACDGNSQQKVEIKPAPKLNKDATQYANDAWQLINQVEPLIESRSVAELDDSVRRPLRDLGNRWMINVKMGDSVTEGNFALCRKSLVSLDAWARAVQKQDQDIAQVKANYLREKALCKAAIDNPKLGNS